MVIHPDTLPIDAMRRPKYPCSSSTGIETGSVASLNHWQPIGAVIARIIANIKIVPDHDRST